MFCFFRSIHCCDHAFLLFSTTYVSCADVFFKNQSMCVCGTQFASYLYMYLWARYTVHFSKVEAAPKFAKNDGT